MRLDSLLLMFMCLLRFGHALDDVRDCNSNPYIYFSTKTSYFAVGDTNRINIPEGCSLDRFWLLARHGTRNPGDDDIIQISKTGPRLQNDILFQNSKSRGEVCQEDISAFKAWQFDLKPANESMLTDSGFQELEEIAKKFKKDFPDVLNIPYEPKWFKFRHTNKERTLKSAIGFAKGLFPNVKNVEMDRPLNNDPILEFEDFCPKWKETVDDSENKYRERNNFYNGPEMESVLQNVQNYVGSDKWTLLDVLVAYDICRFNRAWSPQNISVWCTLFTVNDLEVLEYYEDLKYWYTNGYWKKVTTQMACPLIKDIVHFFELEGELKGKFNFAHRQTVLPFLGLLGLYKDKYSLKHSNFNGARKRLYRSSLIGSFAANVAFVLMDCSSNGQKVKKIMAMHQGKVIKLPKCSSEICDYQEFKNKFKNAVECNYNQICNSAWNYGKTFSFQLSIFTLLYGYALL